MEGLNEKKGFCVPGDVEYPKQGSRNWEEGENTFGEKRKGFSLDRMGWSGRWDILMEKF